VIAFLLGLLPASWWFITSFLANDGDILGVFTNAKSIAKFGNPDLPSLARAWDNISLTNFLKSTFISLYANWGWMSLPLKSFSYAVVSITVVLIMTVLWRFIDKRVYIFFILLLLTNIGFMLLYSTFYDYQAQGRYLFPSVYIIVGMISTILVIRKVFSKRLLLLLVLLSALNVYFSARLTLTSYVDFFWERPVLWSNPQKYYDTNAALQIDQIQIIDGKLMMRGWTFDRKLGKAFDKVDLILKHGNEFYKASLQEEVRPDVASVFKNDKLRSSGFSAKMIDLRNMKNKNTKVVT